jgi:hypothetical protein
VFFNAAEFGVLADYVSPDNSTTVPGITILIDDRIDGKPEQSGRTVTAGHVISVRVSEVPAPAKDGRFVVGSAAHVIVGKPFLDDGGTIWMCMTA